jgi:S1-C subfamily serine protease
VRTQDAYGRGPVARTITSLRGLVRSGNSGGPVVDGKGRVLTTVFASTVGSRERAGFGVPDSVVASALAKANGSVGTGACAH